MEADLLLYSRIQFAANISFHILFPTISIALAWVLLYFKWRFNRTQDLVWRQAYALWVKIFALTFALGVVSGITMSFQFGTNWPGYMETVGNIAGPLLAYEVLTAFFLEATFLGIMLFGQGRVSNRMHTLATVLVALGTTASAFWILVLNSWMHTPVGYEIIDGKLHASDWWAIIFNPSMPYRLSHMLVASGLTVAFLTAGLSAYRLLRKRSSADALVTMRTGLALGALLIPVQIFLGDLHGLNTVKYQPAKIAAIEAVWETERGAPLQLFAWPDEQARENKLSVAVPKLASLILTHDLNGEIKGLNEFAPDHPPVKPVFFAFRVMVGVGMLMLLFSWFACYQLWRRKALPTWLLRVLVGMTFSGWIATLAGWYVTEIGRQPWLVQGVLRTTDAVTRIVPSGAVAFSLTLYLLIYVVLIAAYVRVLFYLAKKADQAPLPAPVGTTGSLQLGNGA